MKAFVSKIVGLFAKKPDLTLRPPPIDGQPLELNAPYGLPVSSTEFQILSRRTYISAYDATAKIPAYVIWTLTPDHALGCVPRSNSFSKDHSVTDGPTPGDYEHSGFDKGHMSPDDDQAWDVAVEHESFMMTNMTPQSPALNRGIWKLLETSFRGWVVQLNRPFTAISGAIYSQDDKKIGKGVVVPHAFYKVVIDSQTKQYAAWYFPHVAPYPDLGNDLTKFRKLLTDIEKETTITISLPDGAKEIAVGQEWPVDFGKLEQAKKEKCHGVAKS